MEHYYHHPNTPRIMIDEEVELWLCGKMIKVGGVER
jgi:hypothetical protein